MVEAVITNLEIPDHDGKGIVSHNSSIFTKYYFAKVVDKTCAQQQVVDTLQYVMSCSQPV